MTKPNCEECGGSGKIHSHNDICITCEKWDRKRKLTPQDECPMDHARLKDELYEKNFTMGSCPVCEIDLLPEPIFWMSPAETEYIVKNIQNEYLNQDTYYFARDLFNRMEEFLKKHRDELARRNSRTA